MRYTCFVGYVLKNYKNVVTAFFIEGDELHTHNYIYIYTVFMDHNKYNTTRKTRIRTDASGLCSRTLNGTSRIYIIFILRTNSPYDQDHTLHF